MIENNELLIICAKNTDKTCHCEGRLHDCKEKVRPEGDDCRDAGGRRKQEPESRGWPGPRRSYADMDVGGRLCPELIVESEAGCQSRGK